MRRYHAAALIAAFALMGASRAAPPAAPATGLTVSTAPLPGDGRGDYITIDAAARRLYVTHSAVVHILDADTLRTVATVAGLKAAHGVALDSVRGHGFVTDSGQDAVVMFDLASGAVLKTIPTGRDPDAIVADPASGLVVAMNGGSSTASVIDPATASVRATIKLPFAPEFAVVDGKGKLWVNLEEGNRIAEIDMRALKLVRTIPLAGCDGPVPLALDPADRVLIAGCGNKVMSAVDIPSGRTLARVPIAGEPDGIAFDAAKARLYVANRSGGWSIVTRRARGRYDPATTLPMADYAKTVAVDPVTHRAFSSTADLIWPLAVKGREPRPLAKPGTFRLVVVTPVAAH